MNKLKKVVMIVGVSLAVILGIMVNTVTTAHATTWHKGIPTAMRGSWWSKTVHDGPSVYKLNVKVRKSSVMLGHGPGDPISFNKTSYHHKSGSRHYYIKGHESLYSAGTTMEYVKFYKVGNKMTYKIYAQSSNGKFGKVYDSMPHVVYYR